PDSARSRPQLSACDFPVREVGLICLITLFAAIAFYVVPVHLGFFLDAQGEHSAARIGRAIGITSVSTMVGAASYPLLARLGIIRHLSVAFAFMSVGLFFLAKAPDYNTVVVTASVNALGCGMVIPALLNWMMRD